MGYYMAGGAYEVESQGSGGSTWKGSGFIQDDGPPRRLNKWNGKALTRAMRRVKGFARVAKKAVRFTQTVRLKKRRRS